MSSFFSRIETFFKNKSIFTNLIAINIIVFLLLRLFDVIATLFKFNPEILLNFMKLPADFAQIITLPWTLITYMFAHYDFLHILFNMLWLYWFGKIFLLFFNPRQLSGLYILGGLAGALFFILSYNYFPYFEDKISNSTLIGASASVMAIVFGVAFYRKNFEIPLLLFGRVKIIYLALFTLVLDMLSITSSNAGGHIAHIGGALLGICFAHFYLKGKDITSPLNLSIDKVFNLFKKKPKKRMKVNFQKNKNTVGSSKQADYDYNAKRNQDNTEIDRILEKIKKSGYNCLTEDEKKRLFDASNK